MESKKPAPATLSNASDANGMVQAARAQSTRLTSRLKVQHLAVLVSIGRLRNTHLAGEERNLSQPAISKIIREVEDIFGTSLFDRSRNGMHPNRIGEALILRAEALLNQLEDTKADIEAITAGEMGHLRLGVVSFIPPALISHTLQNLSADQVNLSVEIREETTAVLIEQLLRKELDCVIGRFASARESQIVQTVLCHQQFCIVVSQQHPTLGLAQKVRLKDTTAFGWIVPPPRTAARSVLSDLFARAKMNPPSIRMETSSLEVIKAGLTDNHSVALLPRDIALQYVATGQLRILPIRTDYQLAPITLIRRRDEPMLPAGERFCTQLVRTAEALNNAQQTNGLHGQAGGDSH